MKKTKRIALRLQHKDVIELKRQAKISADGNISSYIRELIRANKPEVK